jgi:acetyl esterase/lipase
MSNDMMDRLDPELVGPVRMMIKMRGGGLNFDDIPAARAAGEQMMAAMKGQLPVIEGVTAEDRNVPGPDNGPDVALRIYRPDNRTDHLPAILWIHGGGYILGNIENDDFSARQMSLLAECIIVSVEYRLAPENPYPAPLEDCYAALKWLAKNADELGADPERIAIGGGSAGGGLAAGLALMSRDLGEVDVMFQFLIYPMIDDRNIIPASNTLPDTIFWTRESNRIGWRAYLGCEPGGDGISCYAAASRATDLTGLPPAYIAVGEIDLFAQEDIEYARRLIEAGVCTELHVYPGGCHGFDMMAPDAAISRQFADDFNRALMRVMRQKP